MSLSIWNTVKKILISKLELVLNKLIDIDRAFVFSPKSSARTDFQINRWLLHFVFVTFWLVFFSLGNIWITKIPKFKFGGANDGIFLHLIEKVLCVRLSLSLNLSCILSTCYGWWGYIDGNYEFYLIMVIISFDWNKNSSRQVFVRMNRCAIWVLY